MPEKNEQGAVCGEAPEAHSARGRGVRAQRVGDTDQGDQDHVGQGQVDQGQVDQGQGESKFSSCLHLCR